MLAKAGKAGRRAQPGHGPVCRRGQTDRQTGGPGPGRRQTTQSVEQVIHLSQKNQHTHTKKNKTKKKKNPVLLLWSPRVRVVFYCPDGRTNSLFHSGDFFRCCKCHSGSHKQQERVCLVVFFLKKKGKKEVEGGELRRRGDDVRESRRKTNKKTSEKSCGSEVSTRRRAAPPLLSSPLPKKTQVARSADPR